MCVTETCRTRGPEAGDLPGGAVVQAGREGRRAGLAMSRGLRVPPAAPPVLSGHRQGGVKDCGGGGEGVSRWRGGTGTVAEWQLVASVLPPSGVGGQTGTMWRPKLSA